MDELKAALYECAREMPLEELKECIAENASVEDVEAFAAYLKKNAA